MESSSDRDWAIKYLLDPLNASEPSQDIGRFSPITPTSPSQSKRCSSTSKQPSVSTLPTPPLSASPTRTSFAPTNPFSPTYRQSAFSTHNLPDTRHSRHSLHVPPTPRSRRHSSSPLPSRFPGDTSMRPLAQIRAESKSAHRSPHLRRNHIPGADVIDGLDQSAFGVPYHHEGPYDATLLVRNTDPKNSPVAATRVTNEEAIRATPREHIVDSLTMHVPLHGTAMVPSGERGPNGEVMQYEEGADLQREADASGGPYKRWPGLKYHVDDLKGKGEPSYIVDKALKEHKRKDKNPAHRRYMSDGNSAYEMQTPRSVSGSNADLLRPEAAANKDSGTSSSVSANDMSYAELEADSKRHSMGHGFGAGWKRKFGSLRKNVRV